MLQSELTTRLTGTDWELAPAAAGVERRIANYHVVAW